MDCNSTGGESVSAWEQIVAALELPTAAEVAKRVPKKLLLERGAPTAGDKRKIQDGIESIHWLASLKPSNLNIRAHSDSRYEYNEIAVLRVEFREKAKVGRLVELIHRAIPYPVVLIGALQEKALFSLAVKRRSEAEGGKFVLEHGVDSTGLITAEKPPVGYAEFLQSLAASEQSRTHLLAFYQSLAKQILTLQIASVKGHYKADSADVSCVRESLENRNSLMEAITGLRAQAKKEKQINRQVELNLEIKELERQLEHTANNL